VHQRGTAPPWPDEALFECTELSNGEGNVLGGVGCGCTWWRSLYGLYNAAKQISPNKKEIFYKEVFKIIKKMLIKKFSTKLCLMTARRANKYEAFLYSKLSFFKREAKKREKYYVMTFGRAEKRHFWTELPFLGLRWLNVPINHNCMSLGGTLDHKRLVQAVLQRFVWVLCTEGHTIDVLSETTSGRWR